MSKIPTGIKIGNLDTESAKKIFINPFYAITIEEIFAQPHEPLVTKEQWIIVNEKLIREVGAKQWLETLLNVLEGDYIAHIDE